MGIQGCLSCALNATLLRTNSDAELWKIVNEVAKPKKENEWTIKTDENTSTSDPQEVADILSLLVTLLPGSVS